MQNSEQSPNDEVLPYQDRTRPGVIMPCTQQIPMRNGESCWQATPGYRRRGYWGGHERCCKDWWQRYAETITGLWGRGSFTHGTSAQRMKWTNRRPRFLRHLQCDGLQKFFTSIFFSDAFDRMHLSVPSFAFPYNLPPTFSHPQAIPIITNVARSRPAGTPNNHQQSRLSHPHLVLTPVDPMGAFQCR